MHCSAVLVNNTEPIRMRQDAPKEWTLTSCGRVHTALKEILNCFAAPVDSMLSGNVLTLLSDHSAVAICGQVVDVARWYALSSKAVLYMHA